MTPPPTLRAAPRSGLEQQGLFDPRRRGAADRGAARPPRRRGSDGDRLTLERMLASVWEGLIAAGAAECPICSGAMDRAGEVARCRGCGSVLR